MYSLSSVLKVPIVYTSLLYLIPTILAWIKEKFVLSILLGGVTLFSTAHHITATSRWRFNQHLFPRDIVDYLYRLDILFAFFSLAYISYFIYNGELSEPKLYYFTVIITLLSFITFFFGRIQDNISIRDNMHSCWHIFSSLALVLFILSWDSK